MSVAEAAIQLAVSPRRVRQMVAHGAIEGRRVGGAWIIDSDDVEHALHHPLPSGRPWDPASAWAVLAVANGDDVERSSVQRSRAKRRLAEHGLQQLAPRLAARAQPRHYYGHPSVFERIAGEPDVVRSGASALAEHHVDLVVFDAFEAYVPAHSIGAVVNRYALDALGDRPNIVLRVVDDDAWPFAADAVVAPLPVVALDLLDADDERSRRAGAELLGRLS